MTNDASVEKPPAETGKPLASDEALEASVVLLVGAVQFVNILDFIMVGPLGPFMSGALGYSQSHSGWVTGSYTAAASISGLAGAFFLDKFERKRALLIAMGGLVIGTLSGAFAVDLWTLLAARVLAGAFGGPATSVALSIIADVIPPARRGKAMGKVMGAFAAASVLGVPFGLELTRHISWRAPFLLTAVAGVLVAFAVFAKLPTMNAHLVPANANAKTRTARSMLAELSGLLRRDILLSYGMTFVAMGASFVLIPNISAYTMKNLSFPENRIGVLYMIGGVVSFATARAVGPLIDRVGAAKVGTVGTLVLSLVIFAGFAKAPPLVPVPAVFVGFMFGMGIRNLSYNTLTSKVPEPRERAAFMSVQSSVQHFAAAVGAIGSSFLLTERADKSLEGMGRVAVASIVLGLALPPMLMVVERRVLARAKAAA